MVLQNGGLGNLKKQPLAGTKVPGGLAALPDPGIKKIVPPSDMIKKPTKEEPPKTEDPPPKLAEPEKSKEEEKQVETEKKEEEKRQPEKNAVDTLEENKVPEKKFNSNSIKNFES